ncbi:MAG: HEPN domain-containing protein [bacterium]
MTEENQKINIREEVERADQTIKAARLLYENGFFNDAISRLYYFLLYYIRALLLTKGLEPKSHEGALRLFSLHFVRTGFFKTESSHIFSKMMKYREEADYNPSYLFTKEDFITFSKESEELTARIRDYLKKEGYL